MQQHKNPLIILTGPTAVGKTDLSVQLAKKINGEIISADSMQVYKHMDIGSAKITKEEMDGVKHYLIDEFEPFDEFNVVIFKEYAKKYIEEIYKRGHVPILTGGTGFYLQAVLYDIDFTENESDNKIRKSLEKFYEENGVDALFEKLKAVDYESSLAIHKNNVKRVIRAIEFYEMTGEKISEHNEREKQKKSPYNFCYFVLDDDRENLYKRIDKRVDIMIEKGLVDEVKKLVDMGCTKDMVSMQGLGYKEILSWLEGEISYEEAVYLLKRDTRHFAKRQLTWFRRERDVIWLNKPDYDYDDSRILDDILKNITAGGWL